MSSPWTVPVSNIVTTCARNTTTAASNSTSNPHPSHNYAMSTDSSSASGGQSGATASSSAVGLLSEAAHRQGAEAVGLLSEVAHHQGAEPVHLGSFQRYSTFVPLSQPMNHHHQQQQQQQYISTQFQPQQQLFLSQQQQQQFHPQQQQQQFHPQQQQQQFQPQQQQQVVDGMGIAYGGTPSPGTFEPGRNYTPPPFQLICPMNGSNHGAMSRAASSTALDVQQLSEESNQRRCSSSTTPVGAMSRGASFSTALDVLDADSLNDFDTESPEKGTDVSAPAEWDGANPDAVLARLKALKENTYSPLGLKAFYKSYTTWSKLNAEQQDKALAWFRKLPDSVKR